MAQWKCLMTLNQGTKQWMYNSRKFRFCGRLEQAIKFALENDFDFIWLMDDDGYPDSRALEVLTEFCNLIEISFLASHQ